MLLTFADDSRQRTPFRHGMGQLVAVGGIHVPRAAETPLTAALDQLCVDTGFPLGDEFKWSPRRNSWMYGDLKAEQRQAFFQTALTIAASFSVTATVVIADTQYRRALRTSSCAEQDVTTMFLERVDNTLGTAGTTGTVFFDQPGGNRRTEERFVAECMATITTGTAYAGLKHITDVATASSHQLRLLQLADVVTSCTVSRFAGEATWSGPIFTFIKPLLRSEGSRIGGVGVKVHPDFVYRNLYYWVLGDTAFWKWSAGVELPCPGRYFHDAGEQPYLN
jgi:hypothetical protein